MGRAGRYAAIALAALLALIGEGAANAAFPGSNGKIVFLSDNDAVAWDVYTIEPDGTGMTRLTTTPAVSESGPVWSPDGTKIAFERDFDVWVMDADGTDQAAVVSSGFFELQPAWSPDGTKLAFTRADDIWVVNADGTGLAQLTTDPALDQFPAWSPDGTKITFESRRLNPQGDIFVMNADGSGQVSLTSDTAVDQRPDWSPDGAKIAWERQVAGVSKEIYVMNADGSGAVNLSNRPETDLAPAWSPDGTKIVFYSDGIDLYVMNADGTGLAQLTSNDPKAELEPDWQPQPAAPATLSISDVAVTEGNAGATTATFTVIRSSATGTSSVTFATADGTATAGSDYVAAAGMVAFADGETSKTIDVTVTGDTADEPNESFFVDLSAPSGATLADAQGVGTILDDDAPVVDPGAEADLAVALAVLRGSGAPCPHPPFVCAALAALERLNELLAGSVGLLFAGDEAVAVEEFFRHVATVENRGSVAAAASLRLRLELAPAADVALAVESTAGTCVRDGLTIDCALGSLAPGARTVVTVRMSSSRATLAATSATVSSPSADSDLSNQAAEAVTRVATLDAASDVAGYSAGVGEANSVRVSGASGVIVEDPGGRVVGTLRCPAEGTRGECASRSIERIFVWTKDGDDRVVAADGRAVRIFGGSGSDQLAGSGGDDLLHGGDETDALAGGPGDDVLNGGAGRDTLDGGAGRDVASYLGRLAPISAWLGRGVGEDVIANDVEDLQGSDVGDFLYGNGRDNMLAGEGGDDVLVGNGGDDTLRGGIRNDVVRGGPGDDTLSGGSGLDLLLGGAGVDSVWIGRVINLFADESAWPCTVGVRGLARINPDVLSGSVSQDGAGNNIAGSLLCGIENVRGSDYDDRMVGSTAGNVLDGRGGADSIFGGGGDDVLDGGLGADILAGGTIFGEDDGRRDTVDYSHRQEPVRVTIGAGADDGARNERDDVRDTIEDVIGGAAGDELVGGASANRLFGRQGRDELLGGAGGDALYGGHSDDVLGGGRGRDWLFGGDGDDRIGAADGERDIISCGAGEDFVTADRYDLVDADCERIRRV